MTIYLNYWQYIGNTNICGRNGNLPIYWLGYQYIVIKFLRAYSHSFLASRTDPFDDHLNLCAVHRSGEGLTFNRWVDMLRRRHKDDMMHWGLLTKRKHAIRFRKLLLKCSLDHCKPYSKVIAATDATAASESLKCIWYTSAHGDVNIKLAKKRKE